MFHENQYNGFKGTSVFKILDAPDSHLLELFTDATGNPASDVDSSEQGARRHRIAKTMWTLAEECGAREFLANEQHQMEQGFSAKFEGKRLPSIGPETIVWPRFEHPTDVTPLEKYNRSYELLRDFTTVLSKWSSWATHPFKQSPVPEHLIPSFMGYQEPAEPALDLLIETQPSAKSFLIT